jgi:hypothetical protein
VNQPFALWIDIYTPAFCERTLEAPLVLCPQPHQDGSNHNLYDGKRITKGGVSKQVVAVEITVT